MANSVDTRVVQMEFDNDQFEKGVKASKQSLEQLDSAVDKAAESSSKGLSKLSEALSNAGSGGKLSGALSSISNGFSNVASTVSGSFKAALSAVGTVAKGATLAVGGIATAVGGLAMSGGITRALNIEQAKFQLKGLGVAWKDIEGDIDYAVKGTAYGLDSAAKAASQLSASGVKLGDDMKAALRGISGVAAMTNSDYDSMAQVFTAVAGQGKVMTQQLRQLELRGLNPSASMAKYFTEINNGTREVSDGFKQMVSEVTGGGEVTEEAIRDLVTKGSINFEMFSKAMDDTFGEHAKDANKTFTGAMSNVKAALARVGAEFAQPAMESLRRIFVSLIPIIDNFKKGLKPLTDAFKSFSTVAATSISKFLGPIGDSKNIEKIKSFFEALTSGYSADGARLFFSNIGQAISNFVSAFQSFGTVIQTVMNIVSANFSYFFGSLDVSSKFRDMSKGFADVAERISNFLMSANNLAFIKDVIHTVSGALSYFATILGGVFRGAAAAAGPILEFLWNSFQLGFGILKHIGELLTEALGPADKVAEKLENAGKKVGEFFTKINEHMPTADVFNKAIDILASGLGGIGNFLSKSKQDISDLVTGFHDIFSAMGDTAAQFKPFEDIKNFLSPLADVFTGLADSIFKAVSKLSVVDVTAILGGTGFLTFLSGMTIKMRQLGQSFFSNSKSGFFRFTDFLFAFKRNPAVDGFRDMLFDVKNSMAAMQNDLNASTLIKIAGAIAIMAVSLHMLSDLDPAGLVTGITGIGSIIALLQPVMVMMESMAQVGEKDGLVGVLKLKVLGSAMTNLAMAVIGLSIAVKIFSTMNPQELAKGLIAVAVSAGILVGAMILLGKFATKAVSGAFAMGLMATSLIILAAAVKIYAMIPTEQIIKGGVAIAALAGGLSLILGIAGQFGGKMIAAAAALAIVSGALILLVGSVAALAFIPMDNLVQGIGGLAAVLGVLAVAMALMQHSLAGAAAMVVASAAILIFTPAILALSALPLKGLGVALLAMAGAFAVMGIAGAALTPVIPSLLALSLALATMSVSVFLVGVGVAALSAGLVALAGAGAGVANLITMMGEAIVSFLPRILQALAEGFMGVMEVIIQHMATITELFKTLALAIISALRAIIPELVSLGVEILISLANGIVQSLDTLITTAALIIVQFLTGIAQYLPVIIQAGIELALSFINSVADGISNNYERVLLALENLGLSMLEALVGTVAEFVPGGEKLVGGLLEGIENQKAEVTARADELGKESAASLQESIDSMKGDVADAASNVGTEAGGGLLDSFGGIGGDLSNLTGDIGSEASDALGIGLSDIPGQGQEYLGNLVDTVGATEPEVRSASENVGKAVPEGVKSGAGNLNQVATDLGRQVPTGLKSGLGNPSGEVKTQMAKVPSAVRSQSGAARSAALQVGNSVKTGTRTGVNGASNAVRSEMGKVPGAARSGGSGGWSAGYQVGRNIADGAAVGVNSAASKVSNAAANMVSNAISAAKKAAASKSPSKKMIKFGKDFGEGFRIGIQEMEKAVNKESANMTTNAMANAVQGFSQLADILDDIDYEPTIRPVLDTSNIASGLAYMNTGFARTQAISAGYVRSQQQMAMLGSTDNSNNSVIINVDLHYGADADANTMALGLASALRSRNLMEGVVR